MKYLIVLITLVMLHGCSMTTVNTDQKPNVDLASYRTFNWMEEKTSKPESVGRSLKVKKLRALLEHQLVAKGLQRSEASPDILIGYYGQQQVQVQTQQLDNVYIWEGRSRYGSYQSASRYNVIKYREGSLVIDFVDTQNNEVIWQTSIYAIVDEADPLGQLKDAIQEALEDYPDAAE